MSTLYVVATPIGNLGDLSPRAAEILTSADRILAEDTRRTRVLAEHVGARARLVSLHAHNEAERSGLVLSWLDSGETLALVSDAGTPLISDPGGRLVDAVIAGGHDVVPIPGPSAVLAALVGSGFRVDRFTFLGFPERKGKGRAALLERVAGAEEPVVLFESPQRLVRLLEDLTTACGQDRRVCVARELTKIHEEFVRGTLTEASAYYRRSPPRGEVCLVINAAEVRATEAGSLEDEAARLARSLLAGGEKPSEVARELTRRLALPRNAAYRIVHDVANRPEGSP
ncbi:MAG: 16S rRNA (cytidine(1402)-2'-O)-methyltransferase [Gemmatimonadetes bacterium]|nr:16S rRNA (cytidine(1402)-2'-O)-methyltransferase [Gemmatimonadota bacterium]